MASSACPSCRPESWRWANLRGEETDQKSWVRSRQFTGRIVTVTNDKVFDEPVYNYTHEFAYIWDEMAVPILYSS